jgi:hypothetical protein
VALRELLVLDWHITRRRLSHSTVPRPFLTRNVIEGRVGRLDHLVLARLVGKGPWT